MHILLLNGIPFLFTNVKFPYLPKDVLVAVPSPRVPLRRPPGLRLRLLLLQEGALELVALARPGRRAA